MTLKFIQALRQKFPTKSPPADAMVVRLNRLKCRYPDGREAFEVRECRDWCKTECTQPVHIEWKFEGRWFVPVAHCENDVDAVFLALRWK